ncbi:MAG TPA: hypothetical protein VIM25_02420 [Candidatus Limnocylindrales bacterium]
MPWRATPERPFPSLGWGVLDWTYTYLPSPTDDAQPLIYTEEQARRIIRWYELHPVSGQFVHLRMVLEEAKGYGKSPFAGSLSLAEFAGPVCFDGWDAQGQPVGVPWGTGKRPPPWVQIAAVSEDQTDNTYGAMYAMLAARDGKIADALDIDLGRTRLYLRHNPAAVLEPVTAAAGSREGQRLTNATLDETHLWKPANGGVKLARTLRRNVAKMGGRSVETTNAPVLGERSVAEQTDPDVPQSGVLHYARRARVEPSPEWPDEQLIAELRYVYDDVPWSDPPRLVREMRDPANTWDDALRYWFNLRRAGVDRAVDPKVWALLAKPRDVPAGTYIGVGFDGSVSRDATVLRACTADGYSFLLGIWERPIGAEDGWRVPRADVKRVVADTFARYKVGLMLCDPPYWADEIDEWAGQYGEEVVLKLDTNQPRRFAPITNRWLTAIREGAHTHDGDEATTRHVYATHLRKVRLGDLEDDGRTMYVLVKGEGRGWIDGALADALAYEAAMTMPPPSTKKGGWAFAA